MAVKQFKTAEGNLITVKEYPTYDWVEFSNQADRDKFLAATLNAEAKTIKVNKSSVLNDEGKWITIVNKIFPVIIRK